MNSGFAALASFVIPGSGQLLQGRLSTGLRQASLAVLIVAGGFPLALVAAGIALTALGGFSAYDAWQWKNVSVGNDAATAAAVAPPMPPQAGWHRGLSLAALIVLQAVAAVAIAFLLVAAALAPMAFDAPGSEQRLDAWAFVIGMYLLPLVAILFCALAWGLQRRGMTWWALATLAAVVLAGLGVMRFALGPGRLW